MIEIQKLWNVILGFIPIIITLAIYWFGVIRLNEKHTVEIENIKRSIDSANNRIDKLDEEKADKYIIDMIRSTLSKIDSKIDRIQEQINNN